MLKVVVEGRGTCSWQRVRPARGCVQDLLGIETGLLGELLVTMLVRHTCYGVERWRGAPIFFRGSSC